MADPWHYARSDFAKHVYLMLTAGPAHAARLFGPRRTGKTEFLLRDLGPYVEARGHKAAYVSLWGDLGSPVAILLYEFNQTRRGKKLSERTSAQIDSMSASFELAIPGFAKLKMDLGQRGKPETSQLMALDMLCERLSNKRKPTFLLLDEVQELPKQEGGKELVAALRTSLDKRRDGLKTVFTGSSEHGLRRMFDSRTAPFFRFAEPLQLPELDAQFVDHLLGVFRKRFKAKIARDDALRIFEACERSPLLFRKWLIKLGADATLTADEAFQRLQIEIAEEFDFHQRWVALSPIQRLTARLVADGVVQIYGAEGRSHAQRLAGQSLASPSQLQSAIKRLTRVGLIEKVGDRWVVNDPLLAAWIRAKPKREFQTSAKT